MSEKMIQFHRRILSKIYFPFLFRKYFVNFIGKIKICNGSKERLINFLSGSLEGFCKTPLIASRESPILVEWREMKILRQNLLNPG